MLLEKLTCGVLHISGAAGLRFVPLTTWERVRFIWLFRNFKILQQHVLPDNQQKWIKSLCETRTKGYASVMDREIACVIGTIIIPEASGRSAKDERRMAPRLPLPFEVRYGVGTELYHAEGCDLSETGMAFSGARMFGPGNEITVHYRLGSNGRDSWTRTRAVVRNNAGTRMGVEFCIIHPRDRAQLRELTRPAAATAGSAKIPSGDRVESCAVGDNGGASSEKTENKSHCADCSQ